MPIRGTPVRSQTPRPSTPAPPIVLPDPATETDTTPEWRKEVTRKVREYGEKKKILTTPPQPLREQSVADPVPEDASPAAEESRSAASALRSKIVAAALARVEPPPPPDPPESEARVAQDPAANVPVSALESPPPVPGDVPASDIVATDLEDSLFLDEFEEEETAVDPPLLLGRRAAALLIDHIILIVLHAGLLYLCAEIISYHYEALLREAWLPIAGVFLLFHCLYYCYFYKTSRQTPGMVFPGIELRDPLSGQIAMRKVLARWLSLVFLNFFNLVPLLVGRRFLLLDRLSGTGVRTLK